MYWRVMEYISDFTSVLPPVLLTAAVYALLRRLWLRRRGLSRKSWGEEFARLLLVCWLAGLLALVWTPGNFWIKLRNRVGHGIPMELGDWLSVSYTHLDVYKRQGPAACRCAWRTRTPGRPPDDRAGTGRRPRRAGWRQ